MLQGVLIVSHDINISMLRKKFLLPVLCYPEIKRGNYTAMSANF
jgi:hypothetical protein